jgi:hypothetical protein
MAKKYVVLYEVAEDGMEKARSISRPTAPAAISSTPTARFSSTGPSRGPEEGSMAVFTTRQAAEEFVRGDSFVLNGVIANWQIREWDEAYG